MGDPFIAADISLDTPALAAQYAQYKERLDPVPFEILIAYGQAVLREGRVRQAIELTREALLKATQPFERALSYLMLVRMYRTIIQMNNARSELERGFAALKLPRPKQYFGTFLLSLAYFLFWKHPTAPMYQHGADERQQERIFTVITGLYVEAGLSAYYMRQFLPLLEASLWSRAHAFFIKSPVALVEWYGGSGAVAAVIHLRRLSNKLLAKAEDIARNQEGQYARAKAKVWQALAADYLGDPARAAALFRELLNNYTNALRVEDLNVVSTTLSCNCVLRGHMRESLEVIERTFTEYDRTCSLFFSCRRTFVDWYRIPALAFFGRADESEEILKRSRGIFSSVDQEKWQISQYLGNVLIHLYMQRSHDFAEIEHILKRFAAIKLSPRRTFLEACHFWVARAYLMADLYAAGKVERRVFARAVRDLAHAPHHPNMRAHLFAVRAREAAEAGRLGAAHKYMRRARMLAEPFDNRWVAYELYKCGVLISFKEGNQERAKKELDALDALVRQWEWNGCATQLERLRERVS